MISINNITIEEVDQSKSCKPECESWSYQVSSIVPLSVKGIPKRNHDIKNKDSLTVDLQVYLAVSQTIRARLEMGR